MSASKLSDFEIRRAANMAVNNAALAAITPLLVATTKPKAVVKKKIAVEQTVAVAEPRKQSQRLAAKPKRSYAEADLFPALPFEYIAIKKAKSKNDSNTARDKNKKGKKDGSDDNKKAKDKDQAINSNGDIKARPAYKDRPEWGLNRVTISEVDLAIIRDDYAAIRLPGFMVDGKHPKDFSTVKKTCRITNREFDKLNLLKEARKEKLLKKSKANDNEWVAASIIASERFEKAMADRVEAAKDKKASK